MKTESIVRSAIDDPVRFLSSLGGLHDAEVKRVSWDPITRVVHLEVDDLNANLVGLPEYPGLKPCTFVFGAVDLLDVRCDAHKEDFVRVFGLQVIRREEAGYELALQLSPSGQIKLQFNSVVMEVAGDISHSA